MIDIQQAIAKIIRRRQDVPAQRSVLVAISGIDGSGKGHLTRLIVEQLCRTGLNSIHLNVDGWLNLPAKRFSKEHPAQQFYDHAIRFEEMFQQLVLPLRKARSISLMADFTEETATSYRQHLYQYRDVDVIVLEGIYLLKEAFRSYFDLSFWIECSFETALERALQRGQEQLPPAETIQAYETIYFPAQRIHFAKDNPRSAADFIIANDPRLEPVAYQIGEPELLQTMTG